jgi:hypothetical protein
VHYALEKAKWGIQAAGLIVDELDTDVSEAIVLAMLRSSGIAQPDC